MTRLSVNINKIATIRNARGANNPDLVKVAKDCERFGAEGITVHPRPDERHITKIDVLQLKEVVTTEFNIEGYPDERYFEIIEAVNPTQATLVPDAPDAITSNAGWDTMENKRFLQPIVERLKNYCDRVSIFVDADIKMVEGAKSLGADRIELYTEPYASKYHDNREEAISTYIKSAEYAKGIGLGVNAGHDLDLENLAFLKEKIPHLAEVSIGHALVCDALYLGLENTIAQYKRKLAE